MVYIGYDELWKKIYIDGKQTKYSISNMGHVRNDHTNKLVKPTKVQNKYYVMPFTITDDTGKKYRKHKILSRLVA